MVKISFTLFNMEICCFNEIELQWQKSFDHNSRADIVGTKSMLQDWQNEELPIIKHNTILDGDFLFICSFQCKQQQLSNNLKRL